MKSIYEEIFSDYISFIKSNFPSSIFANSNDERIKEFFLSINNNYVLANTLFEFDFIKESYNYYSLFKEYQIFTTRLLSVINLNDKYLIDNIFRLLVEKLYRIITGIHNSGKTENRLRKLKRSEMSTLISNKIHIKNKNELDTLYVYFSKQIHMSNLDITNLYDIRKIYTTDQDLDLYLLQYMNKLNHLFIEEVFYYLNNKNSTLIGTNMKIKLHNELSSDIHYVINTIESYALNNN